LSEASERLARIRAAGLHRHLRTIEGAQGPRVELEGVEVLLLCSNNYLGLADHPRVRSAAAEAADRFGAGAGASRLISGSMSLHAELERRLAAFKGTEGALLFGSGYLANVGVVSAIANGGVVFSDELNHASIIDGCRLAGARTFIYRHRDTEHLEWGLREAGEEARLIVTDGVFSMDGDVAPLCELAALARRSRCMLMVDEAHGTGALGPGGRGAVAAAGLAGGVDIVIGTLGKALGGYGAYACASRELIELLVNTARPFIYSTAPQPPSVGAALAALDVLEARPYIVEQLRRNAATLRGSLAAEGLEVGGSRTQIIPLIVGDARAATALCERALRDGVFAQAIRPPTVPDGSSRLRLTVMATHRADELRGAAHVIARHARSLGLIESESPQIGAANAGLPRAA
jgi:glycine C-acetyltransferase/8-amino-7-oxononanoate synthase